MLTRQLLIVPVVLSALFLSACGGGGAKSNAAKQVSSEESVTSPADQNTPVEDVQDVPVGLPVDVLSDDELVSLSMQTGDPSDLPDDAGPIIDRILSIIDAEKKATEDVLSAVYGSNSISFKPSRHSQFVSFSQREGVYPLIRGNNGLNLAAAVETDGQRSAAFGTNIIRNFSDGTLLDYENNFRNLMSWLLNSNPSSVIKAAKIRWALMDNVTVSRSAAWLNGQYDDWDVIHCADESALYTCLSDADLVITGSSGNASASTVSTALEAAQSKGAALLYVHLHGWNTTGLTNTALSVMNLSMKSPGNYFSQDIATWDNYQQMLEAAWDLDAVYTLVSSLKDNHFSFDISRCASACDESYYSDFEHIAQSLRNSIQQFDKNKVDIFKVDTHRLEKLMVLLGDYYRRSISYPLDVSTSDSLAFLQAYLADHLVYNYREFNPVQVDLGNFSRTDFSHITPGDKTVRLMSKKNFRSAGVYALPGQTFSVKRSDDSEVNVSIFINTQRSGSTHQFDSGKYNRPKYLKSTEIPIASGETIQLTSPYGGPVQLAFNTNDQPVALTFSNIGQHPHWLSKADNQEFLDKMDAGDFDWAEVVTPHFEIHSRLDNMRKSLALDSFNGPEALAAGTQKYIHNYPHVLAGFQGPGIDVVPEIHEFAERKGREINNLDMVKHMNSDQPTCGAGCSGNPYDAIWVFNPTGHGDIHELGHGLEKSKFRFAGWDGHATTNPYSYYSKSKFHEATDTASSCQNLPFERLFNTLKESMKDEDPFAHMQAANLTAWDDGIAIYIQIMMAAQDQSSLIDGWHVLARLHILLREFERADNNDEDWMSAREGLGFGQFSRDEAKALSNNDWLLIAISYVTEIDYRNFLTMWGLSYSNEAAFQVNRFGFPAIQPAFYQASGNDYCKGLDKNSILIVDHDGDGVINELDAFPNDRNDSADADGDGIGDNRDTNYDLDSASLNYENVELKSESSGLCFGIDSAVSLLGQELMAINCNNDGNTLWSWGRDGRIHVVENPSLCLHSESLNSGARLTLSSCSASTQAWAYDSDSKAVYSQVNPNLAFDLYRNGQVNLYTNHGNSNQQWSIIGN